MTLFPAQRRAIRFSLIDLIRYNGEAFGMKKVAEAGWRSKKCWVG